MILSKARGYAKIEYAIVRMYIIQKIEYAYDTYHSAILNKNSISYTTISDIGHIGIIMHAHTYLFILEC